MTVDPEPPRRSSDLAAAFDRHRQEIHVHCYRMTGSVTDAEDLTQETFLRAWRARDRYEHRASLRTWLYRIATNACLDHLARQRRATRWASPGAILEHDHHLDPYPDQIGGPGDPSDAVASKETTELAVLAALLYLSPRQRVAFIARDLIGLTAVETAELLETSVPSANSLVQRARARVRPHLDQPRTSGPEPRAARLVRRYVHAHEHGDVEGIMALLADDIRIAMPPEPPCLGAPSAAEFFHAILGPDRPGSWRLQPVRANGRPATANYLRRDGDDEYRALSIDVLEIRRERIVAIRCFLGDRAFQAFQLPLRSAG
ncbi:RNA polymerase subunit sigma-70 [Rhabdothermincola sediminis]|uniref:RNA polymerase subunit sigma-70 n=1 Tax=Rhabdothermincola sediminis TaxID=2751370 RepID=UPI001AA074E7|nr:RNA polymerase subunit sigma-70 [Rhabdothermincola sediminis]